MQCDVFVAGVGVSIPPAVPVEAAIAAGRYDRKEAEQSRQLAASTAPDVVTVADLATAAARQALEQTGLEARDVGLVLHSSIMDTGLEAWNPAGYIQRELGIPGGATEMAEIRSGCAGSILGLRWSQLHLQSELARRPAALITAAECFDDRTVDRWRSEPNAIMGDAGSALVVSRTGGFARIASTATYTDPELEGLSRGNTPFVSALDPRREYPVNLGRRAREFFRSMSTSEVQRRVHGGVASVIDDAISVAGVKLHDVDHVVLPFLGWKSLKSIYFDGLGLEPERTTFEYSRRIGHTCASDPFIGLHHLVDTDRLHPGDWVLMVAVGIGFIWTAAVLQVTER